MIEVNSARFRNRKLFQAAWKIHIPLPWVDIVNHIRMNFSNARIGSKLPEDSLRILLRRIIGINLWVLSMERKEQSTEYKPQKNQCGWSQIQLVLQKCSTAHTSIWWDKAQWKKEDLWWEIKVRSRAIPSLFQRKVV